MTDKDGNKKTEIKFGSLEIDVLDVQGKEIKKIKLNGQVFDGKVNTTLMHQAVTAYLANQRKGLASTKTKGEVRGGGAKPWRQKGTGRARAGSRRSPIWSGGGVTFGPKPRSYYKDLPKKMKIRALKSALNAKLNEQQILILNDLAVDSRKTKNLFKIIDSLKLKGEKTRFVVEELEDKLKLASRNIKKVLLTKAANIHTTEVIDCKRLVLTNGALKVIEDRVLRALSPANKN